MSFRGAAIWMVLAGLLGGLLLWARALQRPDTTEQSFRLGLDSAAVVGLRTERQNGSTETLLRGADGLWVLEQEEPGEPMTRWPADEARVRSGVRLLASGSFDAREPEPNSGTPTPIGSLSLQLRGGLEKQIVFEARGVGGRVPVTVQGNGESRAGWADRTMLDTYFGSTEGAGLDAWRDHAIGANVSPPDRFTIEALGERVSLRKLGGRWMIQEPVLIEADNDVVDAVVAELSGMQIERFLDRADPADPAYGLAQPRGLIELGWASRTSGGQRVTRRLTLGSLTNAAGQVLHAQADWSIGDHAFPPAIVTVGVPEFPVSADSYLRKTASSLSATDLRGVTLRRRSDNATTATLTRTIDGWFLGDEPDRDGVGAALFTLVCARRADSAKLIEGDEIESMPGYLGEFGLVAGGEIEAEVFHVALPTTDTPSLRLIGKRLGLADSGTDRHVVWSYAGTDADTLVAWFADHLGM